MKKLLLLLFVISLLRLPALAQYEHPMDTMLQTWIGHFAKEAVKVWGNPTDIDYERGQTKYIWEESSSKFIPGTEFSQKTVCKRIFITDVAGRIVYGKFSGNGCPFTTTGVKEKYPSACK